MRTTRGQQYYPAFRERKDSNLFERKLRMSKYNTWKAPDTYYVRCVVKLRENVVYITQLGAPIMQGRLRTAPALKTMPITVTLADAPIEVTPDGMDLQLHARDAQRAERDMPPGHYSCSVTFDSPAIATRYFRMITGAIVAMNDYLRKQRNVLAVALPTSTREEPVQRERRGKAVRQQASEAASELETVDVEALQQQIAKLGGMVTLLQSALLNKVVKRGVSQAAPTDWKPGRKVVIGNGATTSTNVSRSHA